MTLILFKECLLRNWLVTTVSAIAYTLFVLYPFVVDLVISTPLDAYNMLLRFTGQSQDASGVTSLTILIVGVPLVASIVTCLSILVKGNLFALQTMRFTRIKLFNVSVFASLTSILIPLTLVFSTCVLLLHHASFAGVVTNAEIAALSARIWRLVGVISTLSIIYYFTGVFIGLQCGKVSVHVVLFLIWIIYVPVIGSTIFSYCKNFFVGFIESDAWYLFLIPPFMTFQMVGQAVSNHGLIAFAIHAAVLYFLSLILMRFRPAENEGDMIVSKLLGYYYTFMVSVALSFVIPLFFNINADFVPLAIMVSFISIATSFLIQCLLKNSFRVINLPHIIRAVLTGLFSLSVFCIIYFDVFHYSTALPDSSSIIEAKINGSFMWADSTSLSRKTDGVRAELFGIVPAVYALDNSYDNLMNNFFLYSNKDTKYNSVTQTRQYTFSDKANINHILGVHEMIIGRLDELKEPFTNEQSETRALRVSYTMTNGSLERLYMIPAGWIEGSEDANSLILSDEYQTNTMVSHILQDCGSVDDIYLFFDNWKFVGDSGTLKLISHEYIDSFLAALQKDQAAIGNYVENIVSREVCRASIKFTDDDGSQSLIYLSISTKYKHILAWLEENGYKFL